MNTLYDLVQTNISAFLSTDLVIIIAACLGVAILYGSISVIKKILYDSGGFSFGNEDGQSINRSNKR